MRRISIVIVYILILLAVASYADAKIYFDVIPGQSYKKMTIATPPFKGQGGESQARDMAELLRKDLDFSGFFIVAPPTLIDKQLSDEGITREEIQFGNWRSIGVEFVCKAKLQMVDGGLSLEAYLYDILDGSMVLAKRYRAKPDEWRKVTHKLADDIVYAVTGEKGIMSSRVVFVSGNKTQRDVYIADMDGQNMHRVTNNRVITVSPSVSPDGRFAAFTSYREGRPNVYIMDLAKNQEVYADRNDGIKVGTSWKGRSFAYARTSGRTSEIVLVDAESKSRQTVMKQDGILASPSFSPDGSKLAFVSDRFGGPQIFVKDMSSGDTKRLTYSGNNNTAPVFSPKGNMIAFSCSTGGNFEICIMNSDGSNQRILTDGGFNDSPHFSPCGRYIIYTSRNGNRDSIKMMLLNGDNKRVLKFTESSESQPRFAP